jgi:hypothetical protein
MFPTGYTWAAVLTNITSFLAEPIVAGGTLAVIAIPWVPKLVRMLRSAVSSR